MDLAWMSTTDVRAAAGRADGAAHGGPVRYLEDIYFVLDRPAPSYPHPAVRLLTVADLPLLEAAPPELRSSLWGERAPLMSEGIMACAILDGEIVATALCAAQADAMGSRDLYAGGLSWARLIHGGGGAGGAARFRRAG